MHLQRVCKHMQQRLCEPRSLRTRKLVQQHLNHFGQGRMFAEPKDLLILTDCGAACTGHTGELTNHFHRNFQKRRLSGH